MDNLQRRRHQRRQLHSTDAGQERGGAGLRRAPPASPRRCGRQKRPAPAATATAATANGSARIRVGQGGRSWAGVGRRRSPSSVDASQIDPPVGKRWQTETRSGLSSHWTTRCTPPWVQYMHVAMEIGIHSASEIHRDTCTSIASPYCCVIVEDLAVDRPCKVPSLPMPRPPSSSHALFQEPTPPPAAKLYSW